MKRLLAILLLLPSLAWAAPKDICLEFAATLGQLPDVARGRLPAQATNALRAAGLGFMLSESGAIITASHDAAVHVWPSPILAFEQRDNDGNVVVSAVMAAKPILMVRFVSDMAKSRWEAARPGLPGAREVPCPVTRKWF